jgi:hypothetical protein
MAEEGSKQVADEPTPEPVKVTTRVQLSDTTSVELHGVKSTPDPMAWITTGSWQVRRALYGKAIEIYNLNKPSSWVNCPTDPGRRLMQGIDRVWMEIYSDYAIGYGSDYSQENVEEAFLATVTAAVRALSASEFYYKKIEQLCRNIFWFFEKSDRVLKLATQYNSLPPEQQLESQAKQALQAKQAADKCYTHPHSGQAITRDAAMWWKEQLVAGNPSATEREWLSSF